MNRDQETDLNKSGAKARLGLHGGFGGPLHSSMYNKQNNSRPNSFFILCTLIVRKGVRFTPEG